jgi:peptidoglycan/LPS O-acetylase OafA/YrhL
MKRWLPEPSHGSRLPGVDGLRAIAAGSIVVFHVWAIGSVGGPVALGSLSRSVLPKLPLGVTLFFVISGFLLYRPFAAAIIRAERGPGLFKYLRNRALRILPAYWVILLLTGLVLRTTLLHPLPDLRAGSLLLRPAALVMDAFFVQNYHPATIMTGIGPAWSLAIEVVFYLTLPLLALLGGALARGASTRSGRRLATLAPAAAFLVIGLSGKLAALLLLPPEADPALLGWTADWSSVVERSFWAQADLFSFGMVVAVIRTDVEDGAVHLPSWWRGATVAGFVLVALGATRLADAGAIGGHGFGTLMALACALFLALVVLQPVHGAREPILVRVLESRILAGIGLISYSLFLWHEPLIRWMHDHDLTLPGRKGFVANLFIIALVGGLLSATTYVFVEAPALRRRRRRAPDLGSEEPPSRITSASAPLGGEKARGDASTARHRERSGPLIDLAAEESAVTGPPSKP